MGAYDGVLKSCAWERRGGHRGEIRLRGSEGKPNPSPSQKHPKADYLLQWEREEREEGRREEWGGGWAEEHEMDEGAEEEEEEEEEEREREQLA